MMACRRVCLADQAYPMNMFIDVYGYGHWIYKIGDGSSGFYIDHTGLAHQLFFWMPMNPEPEWNVIDVIDLSTEEWNDTKTQQVQTKDQHVIQPVQTKDQPEIQPMQTKDQSENQPVQPEIQPVQTKDQPEIQPVQTKDQSEIQPVQPEIQQVQPEIQQVQPETQSVQTKDIQSVQPEIQQVQTKDIQSVQPEIKQVRTNDQPEIQPVQTKEHKTYARICKPASEFDVKKKTLSAMIRRVVENEVEMSVKKKLVVAEGKPCYKADCSGCGYSVDLSFKMLHGDCGEYECPKCGNILTCIKLCANKECGNRVFSRPKSRLFPCFKCSKLEKYRDWWELW